ncbi:hypothetical protein KBB96_07120 [Luteolibacter ambystomatis]|uniref:Uncharacterized protein n=1 Tax=Luteolibacter ambystomatis TaxID=2824561 RepID=A0A975PGE3_9BACT|nr:hypothetical protein [Luteolibacter ambystomatis]QUE52659.1 hypothetical protein KBB96_07120 [Luteolibacter ambystomatis]
MKKNLLRHAGAEVGRQLRLHLVALLYPGLALAQDANRSTPPSAAATNTTIPRVAGADAGFKLLLQQLKNDRGGFTDGVKSSYLAYRKAQAMEELAKHRIVLPAALFAWVEQTPTVASTLYGIRGASPAQALVLLRSLELDLGTARMSKYPQPVLATVMLHAGHVDLAKPEDSTFYIRDRHVKDYEKGIRYLSLAARAPLKVEIPKSPLVKVDTHPKDRPLDMNDHIINFMEEEETLRNGKVSVVPRREVIRACDIVADRKLQNEFNAYMASRQKDWQPLDCGDKELHWGFTAVAWTLPHVKDHTRAYKMFFDAYTAKGRLPAKRDNKPLPNVWLAYQIDNAETRGAILPDAWPFAMYLMVNPVPLREAEFAWEEERTGKRPMRYIEYVNQVAQDPPKLALRRMTAFEFAYGSLPMMRKDGGVCGTHTATSNLAGVALGKCPLSASSPGHSYPAFFEKDAKGIYTTADASCSDEWYFGEKPLDVKPQPVLGGDRKALSLAAAMNYGLQGFADSNLGWSLFMQLPQTVADTYGPGLLKSAWMRNPYNLDLSYRALESMKNPEQLIASWEGFQAALTASKEKPGCPQEGYVTGNPFQKFATELQKYPVPSDRALCSRIYSAMQASGAPVKLVSQYEIAAQGGDKFLSGLTKDLNQHFSAYYRTEEARKAMRDKLQYVADNMKNPEQKKVWMKSQADQYARRGLCLTKGSKGYQVVQDEAAMFLVNALGSKPDEKAWTQALLDLTSEGLKAHVASKRDTPTCKDMAARLEGIIASAQNQQINLAPWAEAWFGIMDGYQRYDKPAWCAKDASSVVIDRVYAEYCGKQGSDASALQSKIAALQKELDRLNADTARGGNQERINAINREIDVLTKQIEASEKK